MYKFNGVTFERSSQVTIYERQTYNMLELLGDVGGLFDGLKQIFEFLLTPIAAFIMKSSLISGNFALILQRNPGISFKIP